MAAKTSVRRPSSLCLACVKRLAGIVAIAWSLLVAADVDVVDDSDVANPEAETADDTQTTSLVERVIQFEIDTVLKSATTRPSDLVAVRVFAGVVLLIGRTHSPELMQSVQSAVAALVSDDPELKYLRNRIRIENVERSGRVGEFVFRTQNRSMNVSLRTRANHALKRVEGLKPSQFRLVTEPTARGTVYILGSSSRHDADRAVEAIKSAGSVQKIVMAIDYID